jgi:hypothetical protein
VAPTVIHCQFASLFAGTLNHFFRFGYRAGDRLFAENSTGARRNRHQDEPMVAGAVSGNNHNLGANVGKHRLRIGKRAHAIQIGSSQSLRARIYDGDQFGFLYQTQSLQVSSAHRT